MALETTLGKPCRPLGRTVASSAASTVNSLPPTVLNRKFIGKCLILTVAAGKGHWSSGSAWTREGQMGTSRPSWVPRTPGNTPTRRLLQNKGWGGADVSTIGASSSSVQRACRVYSGACPCT